MLELSQNYKNNIDEPVIQNVIYEALIDVEVINRDAMADTKATTYCADEVSSNIESTLTMKENFVEKQYASLEHDFLKLGSDMTFFTSQKKQEQGFISREVCDSECKFSNNPIIWYENNNGFSIYGLTFYFDELSDIYPKKFNLHFYNGDDVIKTEEYECNDAVAEITVPDEFTRFKLEFVEMNRPNVRARLLRTVLGVIKHYENDQLTGDLTHEFDIDNTTSRLPIQKLKFSVSDYSGEYDVDRNHSIINYFNDNQIVKAKLKATYRDGTSELIPICEMVLSGEVTEDEKSATFNAQSFLQSCEKEFTATDSDTEMTLAEWVEDIFTAMVLPLKSDGNRRLEYNGILNEIKTKFITETKSCKDLLKMIAQQAGCILYEDRYGVIHIEKFTQSETTAGKITFDNMYSLPKVKKYPAASSVVVNYYNTDDDGKSIKIENSRQKEGLVQTIDNPLIFSSKFARYVGDFTLKMLDMQYENSTSIRGGIEYEPLDVFNVQTKYDAGCVKAMLTKRTLKFNGAINSDITYYIINDDESIITGGEV